MERNITLDYFKIFLSILVITIHLPLISFDGSTPLFDYVGKFISLGIAKIAVPCFFVINGYFMNVNDSSKFTKYLKRILILYITWSLFYLPYSINIIQNIQSFIVIVFLGYSHLWYISSLIFGALLLFLINRYIKSTKIILSLAIILYISGLIIQANTPESTFSLFKYRNFLFTGFPFIATGYILRHIKAISKKNLLYLTLLGCILLTTEVCISLDNTHYTLLISAIVICPTAVLYIIRYGKIINISKNEISYLSAGIYFIHPFVIRTFCNFDVSNVYVFPFVVILSILFSFVIIQANKTLKIFL